MASEDRSLVQRALRTAAQVASGERRPRRVTPAFGIALAQLDALRPSLVDRLRHGVSRLFDDSPAAIGRDT